MKKFISTILLILTLIVIFVQPINATGAEAVLPETENADQIAEPVINLSEAETEDEPEENPTVAGEASPESVIDWDKLLSYGSEIFELAEEWMTTNLDMVVGAILALVTTILGVVTRFNFVPKIITSFKQLLAAVTQYHQDNSDDMGALKAAYKKFETDVSDQIAVMREQSEENVELRRELAELYKEYIMVTKTYSQNNAALIDVTMLAADEMEDLIQTSPLTKADLDAHHERYIAKVKLLKSCQGSAEEGESE